MARRIPRRRGAPSGMLLVLLGLWGGFAPFVGPYFGLAMQRDQPWLWTTGRLLLEIAPAVAVVIGGLLLIRAVTRGGGSLGGLLALAGGVWFVVGPTVSMLWNQGRMAVGPALGSSVGIKTLVWLAFFYALGALIVLLSAYALGFLAALPVDHEAVPPDRVDGRGLGRRGKGGADAPDSTDGGAQGSTGAATHEPDAPRRT